MRQIGFSETKKAGRPAVEADRPAEPLDDVTEGERIVLSTIEGAASIPVEDVRAFCKGVTEERKIAFLIALVQLGNRSRALRASGVSSTTLWNWNRQDPAFNKAFVRAMEMSSDLIEDELIRRAVEGVVEPVFQAGRLVGSIRRYSDHCLTFALKGAKPDKYADRQKIDHTIDVADRLIKARERAFGRLSDGDDKEDE